MQPRLLNIPNFGEGSSVDGTFISVIDCSGSMSSYWAAIAKKYNELMESLSCNRVTITFSRTASLVPSNHLSSDIRTHGGSTTDIAAGCRILDAELAKLPLHNPVTVLFISDGQDTSGGGLQQKLEALAGSGGRPLKFLCLGVLGGFPTNVAMTLRELYHTASPAVPAVFLIEHWSEQAFDTKMRAVVSHIKSVEKVTCDPPVIVVPWEAAKSTVDSETVVCTVAAEVVASTAKTAGVKLAAPEKLGVDAMVSYFRALAQALDMEAIQLKASSSKTATSTLQEHGTAAKELLGLLSTIFEQQHGLKFGFVPGAEDVAGAAAPPGAPGSVEDWLGVEYAAFRNKLSIEGPRAEGFSNVVDMYASGKMEGGEWEAAKRLNIGTVAGKHAQRVAALRHNSGADYLTALDDAAAKADAITSTPPATLIMTADVFRDKGLATFLRSHPNAVDLTMILPLVGLPIILRRPMPGVVTCAGWRIVPKAGATASADGRVAQGAAEVVSTTQLVHIMDGSYRYNIAGEEVTGVLPVLNGADGGADADVVALVRSKAARVLFNAATYANPDAANSLGLLHTLAAVWDYHCTELYTRSERVESLKTAATEQEGMKREAARLLEKHREEASTHILPALLSTYETVYGGNEECAVVEQQLKSGSVPTLFSDQPVLAAFIAWVILQRPTLQQHKVRDAITKMVDTFVHDLAKRISVGALLIENVSTLPSSNPKELAAHPHIREVLKAAASMKQLNTMVEERLKDVVDGRAPQSWGGEATNALAAPAVQLRVDELMKQCVKTCGAATLAVLVEQSRGSGVSSVVGLGAEESGYSAYQVQRQLLRAAQPSKFEASNTPDVVARELGALLRTSGHPATTLAPAVVTALKPDFVRAFVEAHKHTLPIGHFELSKAAVEKGMAPTELIVDPLSLLGMNFCSAKACPFFAQTLPPKVSWRAHMETWSQAPTYFPDQGSMPRGFHVAVRTAVEESGSADPDQPMGEKIETMKSGKQGEFVKAYLKELVPAYAQVLKSNKEQKVKPPSADVVARLRQQRRGGDRADAGRRPNTSGGRGRGRGGRGGRGRRR